MTENTGEGVKPVGERLSILLAMLIASMVVVPVLVSGIGGAVLGAGSEKTVAAAAILLQQLAMFAAAILRLKALGVGWEDLRPLVDNVTSGARGIAWGVGLLFINGMTVQFSMALFRGILGPSWVESMLENERAVVARLLDPDLGSFYLGWIVFMAVGLAPLVEELFFRAYAYPALKFHTGRHAMWLSAILFAAVHMYLINFLPLFLLGIILAWLYEKSGRISVPILAHATMNGLVAVFAVLVGSNG